MSDLFNILDADAQQRDTKRACIVAVARAKKQCGKFFTQAASEDDFMARLALVTDKLNDIVREACIEQNTPDLDTVHHVLASELAAVYGEVMRSDIKDENIDPTDKDAPNGLVEHELDNRKLLGKPEDFKGKDSKTAAGFGRNDMWPQREPYSENEQDRGIDERDSIMAEQMRADGLCSYCGEKHDEMDHFPEDDGDHPPYDDAWERRYEDANGMHGETTLERAMRDDGSTRRARRKTADDGPDTGYYDSSNGLDDEDEIPSIPFAMEEDPAIAEWQNAVMSGETQLGFEEWVLQDESDGGMPEYAERSLGNEDRFGSAKTAVETGDTYTQETVDLPKATPEGSDEPSPKMDKGNAGDENHTSQKPIDVPSVANPVEQQDVTQQADYTKTLDVPGVSNTVNADTPTQPEHNVAPGTQTFKNKDQANPVTSKWKVIG